MGGPDDGKGDDKHTMIANPYLAALRSAKSSASGPASDLAKALDTARTAMEGNCWQSTLADQFFSQLATQRTTLQRCRDRALQEFDDAIARQPEMVSDDSWQRYWHNLGGMR